MTVFAINRAGRFAVLDDGSTANFFKMFDDDGDETADPVEAVTAVIPLPDGTWEAIQFSNFEVISRH